jgi:rhodanese-related sulfurtransferase
MATPYDISGKARGQEKPQGFDEVDATAARKMLLKNPADVVVLDVRDEDEFRGETGHIKGALLIPIDELEERLRELEPHKKKHIFTFCYSGQRSRLACEILAKHGFKHITNVIGGMMEWFDLGYETEHK